MLPCSVSPLLPTLSGKMLNISPEVGVTVVSLVLLASTFDRHAVVQAIVDSRSVNGPYSNSSSSSSNVQSLSVRISPVSKPRFVSHSQSYRPVKHFVRGYMEQCSTQPLIYSPSSGQSTLSTANPAQCAFIYVCFHSTCRCPLGHAHLTTFNQTLVHQCAKFNQFRCQNDTQCQDIDANVVCNVNSRQCRCKSGYSLDGETGYCKKTYEKYKMQSLVINMLKMNERSAVSTAPAPTQSHQFFINLLDCKHNSQCTGEYTYCHRGKCKCWPEFQFVLEQSSLSFNSSAANETLELQGQELSIESSTVNESSSEATTAMLQDRGYCVRRLCQLDSQCQTEDNPNLVCNNTICECRFSYIMYKETKVCMKYVIRRQSCDLTCRIIGGLFASIFMLTLIYWCFYCCYSIVKNYRSHRLQAQCHDSTYYRNMYHDFEPIDYERYLSANSLTRNSRSSNSSRFPVNLSTFLRLPLNDDPPSYTQAMQSDETLPDYEAVMELQELRKADSKSD